MQNDVKKRSGGKHFTWEERVRLEALARALYPGGRKPNFAELAGRRCGVFYTFKSGADFICVGMYDFQLVEDVNLVNAVLDNPIKRAPPWRA